MCVDAIEPNAELIAELCFRQFRILPKTGKPNKEQWTVLAGVVEHDVRGVDKVVALGCGTKCIGQSKLCDKGLILNDSHAEVLARRAFLRYLQNELRKTILTPQNSTCVFKWNMENNCFSLKEHVSFHFFSTQTPCGDACIEKSNVENNMPAEGIILEDNNIDIADIGDLLSNNTETVYTGAKLIGIQHGDSMQQILGALRTKPGRGDRTLSMSCSDKLARWNILGVQGALLDALLQHPIYFKTLSFCCKYSHKRSLERAIYDRWSNRVYEHSKYRAQQPIIRIVSSLNFEYAQQTTRQPSPNGLAWSALEKTLKPFEVSVNGKRQGITNAKLHTTQAALHISKFYLLQGFVDLLRLKPELLRKFNLTMENLNVISYRSYKALAIEYQDAWKNIKTVYFQHWTKKSNNLLDFSLNSSYKNKI